VSGAPAPGGTAGGYRHGDRNSIALTKSPASALGIPSGESTPTRPVANGSRWFCDADGAGGAQSRHTVASRAGELGKRSGQAAVVGRPATSLLSLTDREPLKRKAARDLLNFNA